MTTFLLAEDYRPLADCFSADDWAFPSLAMDKLACDSFCGTAYEISPVDILLQFLIYFIYILSKFAWGFGVLGFWGFGV